MTHANIAQYLLGTARINVQFVKPHPLQRALDQAFVDRLLQELGTTPEQRDQSRLSVCLMEEITLDLQNSFNNKEQPAINFPTFVMDGQHRAKALLQLNEGSEDPAVDNTWLADVYSCKVSEYKGLGVWMVNRNSTDVRKGAVLSDYIRVLSHHETDEERNEAMQFMNSTKDRQAVTFLSKDVLWDTVLEMIEHPFYSGITQSMVLDWRKLGVMTQPFLKIFLEEMIHQKSKIESLIRQKDANFVLTVERVLRVATTKRMSGSMDRLRDIYKSGNCDIFALIGSVECPNLAFGSALFDHVMKWVSTRVADKPSEADRPYFFKKMIPLMQDTYQGRDVYLMVYLMNIILRQVFALVGGTGLVNSQKTWSESIATDKATQPLGPILSEVVRYIAQNVMELADVKWQAMTEKDKDDAATPSPMPWDIIPVTDKSLSVWIRLRSMIEQVGLNFDDKLWEKCLRTVTLKPSGSGGRSEESFEDEYSDGERVGSKRKRGGKDKKEGATFMPSRTKRPRKEENVPTNQASSMKTRKVVAQEASSSMKTRKVAAQEASSSMKTRKVAAQEASSSNEETEEVAPQHSVSSSGDTKAPVGGVLGLLPSHPPSSLGLDATQLLDTPPSAGAIPGLTHNTVFPHSPVNSTLVSEYDANSVKTPSSTHVAPMGQERIGEGSEMVDLDVRSSLLSSQKSLADQGTPTERVNLLWILDPTCKRGKREDSDDHVMWYDVGEDQPPLDFPMDKESAKLLKGYWFPAQGDLDVRVSDYITLFSMIPSERYQKNLMSFSEFKEIVKTGDAAKLKKYEVVMPPHIPINLWDQRYGFTAEYTVEKYLEDLKMLEDNAVPFYPSIAESVGHGNKLKQTQRLDDIARKVTKTPRPCTEKLDTSKIPYGDAKVVKRSFSDTAQHVYFLDSVEPIKIDIKTGVEYLVQDKINSLLDFGELRIGMCQGKVAWMLHTCLGEKQYATWKDIQAPQKILGKKISDLKNPWDNLFFASLAQIEENTKDIVDFATRTLQALIASETNEFGATSLDTFARLDIGIMEDEDGYAQFFVNEIERLPAVFLWRGEAHVHPVAYALEASLYQKAMVTRQTQLSTRVRG